MSESKSNLAIVTNTTLEYAKGLVPSYAGLEPFVAKGRFF